MIKLVGILLALALSPVQAASVATTGISAKCYSQDGLVAMWDGIENVGWGLHDSAATVWKDLKGGVGDGTMGANVSWTEMGWQNSSDGKPVTVGSVFATTVATRTFSLDFAVTPSRDNVRQVFVGNYDTWQDLSIEHNKSGVTTGNVRVYIDGSPDDMSGFLAKKNVLSCFALCGSDGTISVYGNGVLCKTCAAKQKTASGAAINTVLGGDNSRDNMAFRGIYHGIRLYNRTLTAREVQLNRVFDRMRFEGATSNDTGYAYVGGKICARLAVSALYGAELSFDGGDTWGGTTDKWCPTGTVVSVRARSPEGTALVWSAKPADSFLSDDGLTLTITSSVPVAATAQAGDTVTWNNHANNVTYYWDDTNKWTCSDGVTHRVPQLGDAVVIPNRTSYPYNDHVIVVTNLLPRFRTVYVGSRRRLRLGGGWTNKLEADRIVVYGESNSANHHSTITCSGGFTDTAMSNRVWIVAPELILSNAYADISVSSCGYAAKNGPAWGGVTPAASACAPYGGVSSSGQGKTYGSITAPTDPGSGAGGSSNFSPAGGGAIRIEATNVVINGSISASGGTASYGWGGGSGSGGSVFISCKTISGTGTVSTTGGGNTSSSGSGAGGGGRVAVHYDTTAQNGVDCRVAFGARGGTDLNGSGPRCAAVGGSGTVYLSDGRFLKRPGRMLSGYIYYGPDLTLDNELVGENLALTNSLVEIGEGGKVCVTGDLSFVCSSTRNSGLRVTGADIPIDISGSLSLAGARIYATQATRMSVGGDLTMVGNSSVHSSAEIYLKASPTNGIDQAYGATLDIGGKWTMGKNAVYYPVCNPTNGSIVSAVAGSLTMDSAALVDANSAGWAKCKGPGKAYQAAGHGGKGGSANGGKTYGNAKRPLTPGSGSDHASYGQAGGGAIRIATRGKMAVGGTFTANGDSSYAWHYGAGAGAGGSIYLSSGGRLSGKAKLSANGGGANSSGYGGGGGRIAIWHYGPFERTNLTVTVTGGKYNSETERTANWGEDGTIYWHRTGGAMVILR